MRIVITGATSFVGAAAIQELLENGHEVYAVVRPSSRKLETLTGQEAGKNALREGHLHIVENDLSVPELLTEKIQAPATPSVILAGADPEAGPGPGSSSRRKICGPPWIRSGLQRRWAAGGSCFPAPRRSTECIRPG